jgi:hypothetical protein
MSSQLPGADAVAGTAGAACRVTNTVSWLPAGRPLASSEPLRSTVPVNGAAHVSGIESTTRTPPSALNVEPTETVAHRSLHGRMTAGSLPHDPQSPTVA